MIFNNKEVILHQLLDKFKLVSFLFLWLKVKITTFVFDYHD